MTSRHANTAQTGRYRLFQTAQRGPHSPSSRAPGAGYSAARGECWHHRGEAPSGPSGLRAVGRVGGAKGGARVGAKWLPGREVGPRASRQRSPPPIRHVALMKVQLNRGNRVIPTRAGLENFIVTTPFNPAWAQGLRE